MKTGPIPNNEIERLAAIKRYHILDTDEEKDFDDITELAAQICNTPISVITLIDAKRQWFKAKTGWAIKETDRNLSFCAHTINHDDIMIVPDALQDERFRDNPLVTEGPAIRFYAGVPLITSDHYKIGTLAVIDREPRTLSEKQLADLRILGRQVVNLLQLRLNLLELQNLIKEKNDEIIEVFERVSDAFVALDKNWRYTYVNKKAEQIFNKPCGYLIGKHIWTEFPEGVGQPFHTCYIEAMATQEYRHIEEYYPPYNRWFENHIYPSPTGLSIYFRDITDRKNAEVKIQKAIERYDILSKATSDTIWDWDVVTNKIVYNDGITKVFGYEISDVDDQADWWKKNIHPDDLQNVSEWLAEAFTRQVQNWQLEYRFRCADESFKNIYDRAFVLYDENKKPIRIIGAMQDITHKKEEEKRITKAIIDAQEAERNYIGRELHDNINQILVGSLITVSIAKEKQKDVEKASELMEKTKDYINSVIEEVRKLSHHLAPASFTDNSLHTIFENLLSGINLDNRFSIKLYFDEIIKKHIIDDIQLNLYRILQEQIKNILKYSEATAIEITVTISENAVRMKIFDNGKGFDTKTVKTGIGLSNIKKRVELFSGKFILNSAPGKGCEIVIEIPLAYA